MKRRGGDTHRKSEMPSRSNAFQRDKAKAATAAAALAALAPALTSLVD